MYSSNQNEVRCAQTCVQAFIKYRQACFKTRIHSPFVIGVSGPVGAGKSFYAQRLRTAILQLGAQSASLMLADNQVGVISTDHFLFSQARIQALGTTKGAPESYDRVAIEHFLQQVRAGKAVELPVYSHQTYDVAKDQVQMLGSDIQVLILEGLNIFSDPSIVQVASFFVYVLRDRDSILGGLDRRMQNAEVPSYLRGAVIKENWDRINRINAWRHRPQWGQRMDWLVDEQADWMSRLGYWGFWLRLKWVLRKL